MNSNGFLPELDGVILLLKTQYTSVAGHTQPKLDLIYKAPSALVFIVLEADTQDLTRWTLNAPIPA